jgi:hypothetical protein
VRGYDRSCDGSYVTDTPFDATCNWWSIGFWLLLGGFILLLSMAMLAYIVARRKAVFENIPQRDERESDAEMAAMGTNVVMPS